MQAFARERLAPYKRPQKIILLSKLPAADNGKILRKAVVDMARAHCN
nr:hypothetical protein [Achromobacter denitrificans]